MRKVIVGLIAVFFVFFSCLFLGIDARAETKKEGNDDNSLLFFDKADEAAFGGQITKARTYLESFFGIVIKVCLWERPEGNLYVFVVDDCGKLFCSEFVWEVRKELPKSVHELEKDFNEEFSDLLRSPVKLKLFKNIQNLVGMIRFWKYMLSANLA